MEATKRKRPRGNPHQPRETAKLKAAFLEEFRNCGVVTRCADKLGVSRRLIYEWLEDDKDFVAAYAEARAEFADVIRAEIYRRAVIGWDEPVFHRGVEVGTVHKYSDGLLLRSARALMPDEYGEKVDVTSKGMSIAPAHEALKNASEDPETTSLAGQLLDRLAGYSH